MILKQKETDLPLISIVIPTYNRSQFIVQAIESVFNQKNPSVEVIVVDDGSTDDTNKILEKHQSPLHYIYQDHSGISKARNSGLFTARGEFVLFLDSDDYLLPGSFAAFTQLFSNHPELGGIQGGWRIVDSEGTTLSEPKPWYHAPRLDTETWLIATPLQLGGLMMRRERVLGIQGFDPSLEQAEDVDFVWRLSLNGCKMSWIHHPVICYRKHGSNISSQGKIQIDCYRDVIDKTFRQEGLTPSIRQLEIRVRYTKEIWFAWRLFATGFRREAIPSLKRALIYSDTRSQERILEWIRRFSTWFDEIGGGSEDLRDLLLCLAEVLEIAPEEKFRFEELPAWYAAVWANYAIRRPDLARKGFKTGNGIPTGELIAHAKSALLIMPIDDMLWVINRFWKDICERKMIALDREGDAASLYLTAFGRALLARRRDVAFDALRRALQHSRKPRALLAWIAFISNAVRYYARGRNH